MKIKIMRRRKTLKIVLIICFSLLCGCSILRPSATWPRPEKPTTEKINFVRSNDGFWISEEDAVKLANNIDELKAYAEKYEVLVDEMEKHIK